MKCEFCEGETEKRRVKKQHWLDGRLYIVENAQAEVCRECGERYFHVSTLGEIDRILHGEHSVKEQLRVEVVSV